MGFMFPHFPKGETVDDRKLIFAVLLGAAIGFGVMAALKGDSRRPAVPVPSCPTCKCSDKCDGNCSDSASKPDDCPRCPRRPRNEGDAIAPAVKAPMIEP